METQFRGTDDFFYQILEKHIPKSTTSPEDGHEQDIERSIAEKDGQDPRHEE